MRINVRLVIAVSVLSVARTSAAADDLRLVEAARTQQRAAVHLLLKQGVSVDARQADGTTALHWAAQWDDLEIGDALIRARAPVDAATAYGVTPLSLACVNGSAAFVEKLLSAGANPRAAQTSGETALMTCARAGSLPAVRALLARGADVNVPEGQSALMWAAGEGHTEIVRELIARGAEVDARSLTGHTALIFAAREAFLDITKTLLAARADINAAAKDGTTALLVATVRGHTAYAKYLLEQGADPNLGPGFTPLHWAAATWDIQLVDSSNGILADDTEWSAFRGLFGAEKVDLVRALLEHGADPNARARRVGIGVQVKAYMCDADHRCSLAGSTPFLLAARGNDVAVMRELVKHGADPLLAATDGTTPLMAAAGVGHEPGVTRSTEAGALEAVKLCVELGAVVNAVNKAGDTALHGAAWRERADSIVTFLVSKGAKLDLKNDRGWTPLVIAEGIHTGGNYIRSETTAKLLVKLGAAPSPPDVSREPRADDGDDDDAPKPPVKKPGA